MEKNMRRCFLPTFGWTGGTSYGYVEGVEVEHDEYASLGGLVDDLVHDLEGVQTHQVGVGSELVSEHTHRVILDYPNVEG
jgi:hypothetical protein